MKSESVFLFCRIRIVVVKAHFLASIQVAERLAGIIHESGRIPRRLFHTSPKRKRGKFAAIPRLRFGLV